MLPRWRQLSVSIISLISIAVISLVVWLILVFFSVTTGLEKIWVDKLIALTAPVRVLPTDAYYRSYYYQIDSLSSDSDYTLKSIAEKLEAPNADSYNPKFDEELPKQFPVRDLDERGELKDLVKSAYAAIQSVKGFPGLRAKDYEMTFTNARLRLVRGLDGHSEASQSFLTQAAYLGSLDGSNTNLSRALFPLTPQDLLNTHAMLDVGSDNVQEDNPEGVTNIDQVTALQRKKAFVQHLGVDSLAKEHLGEALAGLKNKVYDVDAEPFWVYRTQDADGQLVYRLPTDPIAGDGVLFPKGFKESGVLVGDRGYLSYFTPTTSTVQEQRSPIFVAGFYDPGIVPIGGKYLLANPELTSALRAAQNLEESSLSNGINVRFADLSKADALKKELQDAFNKAGIGKYWKIETFREYDFTKDILQQLRSEKNIFSLISAVIIIVACSNIVSMLIILVNDKRQEIGILRSMGATSFSIAAIFGCCGMIMGLIGSLIGTALAFLTLKNIQGLLDLISKAQGFDAFNPLFYGNTLPHEMSAEALTFVLIATVITSLLAGLIPAIKASSLKPAAILRSEG